MPQIKKIICAIDLSQHSESVARYAFDFAKEIIAGAEESMKDFLKNYAQEVDAKGAVLHGYAADEILSYAGSSGADLIIMGTHGRKGIDRILFGSVAERVVKSAAIPVMTVRPS